MPFDPFDMLKVLAVETRVKILELLKTQGALGSKELAGNLGITPAAVSQHLRLLRQAGLVRRERKGYWIPYSLNEEALEKCGQQIAEICTCGCQGSGPWRQKELSAADLASLKRYEKELEQELETVRQRIQENEKVS